MIITLTVRHRRRNHKEITEMQHQQRKFTRIRYAPQVIIDYVRIQEIARRKSKRNTECGNCFQTKAREDR